MKKGLVVTILVLSSIFVSGCFFNETIITCTKSSNDNGMNSEEKVVTKIVNHKVKTMDTEIKMNMTGQQQAIDTSYNMIKQAYSTFEAKGIKPVVAKTDTGIHVSIAIDFKKASAEDLTKISSAHANKKKEKVEVEDYKKEMQQEGYLCE